MKSKQIIKNPLRQKGARYEGPINFMCKVCGTVFDNHQAVLDHCWESEVGKDEEYNWCASQQYLPVQWCETVIYPDTRIYQIREFGRKNRFGSYDDIYNADGQIVTDGKITFENGDTLWFTNGKLDRLAKENPKVGKLIYSTLS